MLLSRACSLASRASGLCWRGANAANGGAARIRVDFRTPPRRDLFTTRPRWTADTAAAVNPAPAEAAAEAAAPRAVGWWLLGCSGMALGAVLLGGVTRLTESGLSMVDWKPLGRRPPSNDEEWAEEFDKYRQSPEFKYKNSDISMEDFKFIWHMEYGHRMWGRLIGAAFYLPAAAFWLRGAFPQRLKPRILLLGGLLACQGLLGWYMVKSGLDHKNFEGPSDVPRVSQYRLASHLGAAMVFYSLLFWNALDVLSPAAAATLPAQRAAAPALLSFRRLAMHSKALVFLTAISGAFVAGLDAGLVYNSFPLMADRLIPSDLFAHAPFARNFTENPTTVQFDHRILGTTTLCLLSYVALRSRSLPLPGRAPQAAILLAALAWMQVGLGISTLLMYVPTPLAAAHQSGAMATLSAALWLSHELKLTKALKYVPK